MHSNIYKYCRVCGLEYENFYPWGEDGNTPTFDYCDCCGTEFGYQDCNLDSIRKKREEWIIKGAKWFSPEYQPADWNLEKSLSMIPNMYK